MIYVRNGKRINIHAPVEIDGVKYHSLADRSLWEKLGITEVEEAESPEDFSYITHTREEIEEAPYTIYPRKSDEDIAIAQRAHNQQRIDEMERETLLPRPSRDFMLAMMVQLAAQQGINEPTLYARNPGYRKIKDLDEEIKALREAL